MAPSLRTPTHAKKKQKVTPSPATEKRPRAAAGKQQGTPTPSEKRSRADAAAPVTATPVPKDERPSASSEARPSRRIDFSDGDAHFVPVATNKLLNYGAKDVPPEKLAVYRFVASVCDIPGDFEADSKFGSKSGVTHEERAIAAYIHELLPNDDDAFREWGPPLSWPVLSSEPRSAGRRLKKLISARSWPDASRVCTQRLSALGVA